MDFELYINNYEELKKVENFLFRFIYPEAFYLHILLGDTKEHFNYRTVYNDLAQGLVLETF